MTKTPFVSFKAIKQAVSMVQVLEHYGLLPTLSLRGSDAMAGPCPIHKGTNATQFRVSTTKNCWNCFGGCPGGNVLDFVAQMEKVEIRDAAVLLSEWFSLDGKRPARSKKVPAKPPGETPAQTPSESISEASAGEIPANAPLAFPGLKNLDPEHDSLVERGFARRTLEHFGAGYCRKGMMKGRIAIPIHNFREELVAYAGRAATDEDAEEELYKYPAGFRKDLEVYNLHQAVWAPGLDTEGLIVVADFLDVFRLYEAGHENAVALLDTEVTPVQRALLLAVLGNKGKITLLLPLDYPRTAAILFNLIGDFYVRLVRSPCSPTGMSPDHLQQLLEGER